MTGARDTFHEYSPPGTPALRRSSRMFRENGGKYARKLARSLQNRPVGRDGTFPSRPESPFERDHYSARWRTSEAARREMKGPRSGQIRAPRRPLLILFITFRT